MSAKLPLLLVIGCTAVLPLLGCAPNGQVAANRASEANAPAMAAAQRISLDGSNAAAGLVSPASAPAALNNDPAALAARAVDEVHLPDGTVGVRVAKRYYHTITVCRQPDGSFSSDCPAAAAGAKP